MKVYTRRGDDGTTGLRYGPRVRKDAPRVELGGTVDEAQAALGLARAECPSGEELDELLVSLERDLWVLMAEVATPITDRERLEESMTAVGKAMVDRLESLIDEWSDRASFSPAFAVPGANRRSAAFDFARTVVRRAERLAVALACDESLSTEWLVVSYLNRLSDLCWVLARSVEGMHRVNSRTAARSHTASDTRR